MSKDACMEKSSLSKTVQEWLPLLILTAVSTVLGYYGSIVALFLMLIVFLLSILLLKLCSISMKNFSWTLSKGQILGTLVLDAAFICNTVFFDGLRFF